MTSRYRLADSAQQAVGGVLLAGPFVVTEEVWMLASNMTAVHAAATVVVVAATGYGALYGADTDRDPDREARFGGLPVRFLSLMTVSYGSVALLALALTAPTTFLREGDVLVDPTRAAVAATALKAVCVGAVFAVVGAATADSIF